ncbi:PREDICTED: fetuin-B-like [Nanorana parkeri]|uniref:fetuin-B-like n=1 Tax=Nanorana parkeri TaxID=125878 RepID=UPI000854133A|nr:PREDICTED: fetuin-B-like [Nanorana parkeri]
MTRGPNQESILLLCKCITVNDLGRSRTKMCYRQDHQILRGPLHWTANKKCERYTGSNVDTQRRTLQELAGKNRGNPEPELTSIACNDTQAEAAADLSLRQLNAHRRRGFVFGLNRITNVQEQFDEENGSVFYLTLDVLETDCHVLSRKLWNDCQPKPSYEAVFGECKVTFQLSKPKRIAHLHNYDCVLTPGRRIGCGGCLFPQPLNDTNFVEVAKNSLGKFNSESNNIKYFLLGNITKAASQVVAGRAYHVEYTIHESSCNKSTEDPSQCEPLNCEFAHTGYCKSFAVAHWSAPGDKQVKTVSCDIFEPEV